jgi:small subunit ribosomal protein S17
MPKKIIQGKVIKIAGDKTASVLVERRVIHSRYHKIITKYKKYLIHDEANEASVGDLVSIVESPKISKRKSFRLKEILNKGVSQ